MYGLLEIGLLSFLLVGAAHSDDWPTYLHDNSRTGAMVEGPKLPLERTWVYSTPSELRRAWIGPEGRTIEDKELRDRIKFDDAIQVAVVEGRVYFGSSVDHKIYCRDAATGEELWSFFTGGPVRLAPTIWQGRVLVGSDDGYAYCLDAQSGREIWKIRLGPDEEWLLARGEMISRWPVRTGILVDEGIAYFGAGIFPHENVYLGSVDIESGEFVWKNETISHQQAGQNDLTPQGYLLASEDFLFVPSGRSLPAVVDRKTGRILRKLKSSWRREGVVGGSKALLADGQIYSAGARQFLPMDQMTGNVGFGYFAGRQMAVVGEEAYLANGSMIQKIDRQKYAKASRQRHKIEVQIYNLSRKLRSPDSKADEYRKRIAELRKEQDENLQEGVFWQSPCALESSLIVAGDLVLVGGGDRVAAFRTSTGDEAWSAKVEGEVRGLAVADKKLFVSTTTGKIYCFAEQGTGPGTKFAQTDSILDSTRKSQAAAYPKDEWTAMYETAAERILQRTGITRGFCLVLGSETGRLAYELAKRSELKIFGIEPDEQKVRASRQALFEAGLYGHRVTIHHSGLESIPYSNYFSNLIVSDRLLRTGRLDSDPTTVAGHLKPCGGVIFLGKPTGAPGPKVSNETLYDWLSRTGLGKQGIVGSDDTGWAMLTRGKLPGAGSWTHQYGEPGNTACSDDQLVRGGLGVLWYGDPGPGLMVNRHSGAVGPVATNGRLFIQGQDRIMAYDAYNGLFLWEYEDTKAWRTGVQKNSNPGNLAANDESLFVMVTDVCLQFDAATGEIQAQHRLPESVDDGAHQWGYVAYSDGLLFGTATKRKIVDEARSRRGQRIEDASDSIFAIEEKSGQHLWSYEGGSISSRTIALTGKRVFFIDSSITSEERSAILRQDKNRLRNLTGQEAKRAEERLKRIDLRLAVALDARTGKKIWEEPVDVTDCSEIGTGGGKLTMMLSGDVLILCGANANGHYWKQFLSGEFERRRLVALSAPDGYQLWAKDANYRIRPIIVGSQVIAEPWAYDLFTGEQRMRAHPLTGKQVPWSFMRTGHHCGMNVATPNMLFFRSGFTGFYDLEADSGTRHFAGHRLGCWINAIPANGLVMIPEASVGCVCLFSLESTVVLEPREPRRPWSIYSGLGAVTPVQQLSLNLGAPGDRRDASGNLWLGYPRPRSDKQTGLDLSLGLQTKFLAGGGFFTHDGDSVERSRFGDAWIHSSGSRGMTRCSLPLRGKGDGPAVYTVRLYFSGEEDDESGRREFDVRIQNEKVLESVDVLAQATGARKILIREIPNVTVTDDLVIELLATVRNPNQAHMPILSGIQVVRTSQ